LSLRHVDGISDYVRLLVSEPAAVDALFADLLIRATSCFRDPDAWHILSRT